MQENLFETRTLSDEQEKIYHYLRLRKGKAAAISAPDITLLTGIADRRARAVIKELVEVHGLPVASCPSGFFVPANEEEVQAVYRQYHSWGMSMLKRASRFGGSARMKELLGQLELEAKE